MNMPDRLLLPVLNLNVTTAWDVGRVRFHSAGAAGELVEAARAETSNMFPAWYEQFVTDRVTELDRWAVAEVTCPHISEAIPLVECSIAALRLVQHLEHPMVDMRAQTFGLPSEVRSARMDYVNLAGRPSIGWKHRGVLAGWTLNHQAFEAWQADPAYRFIDDALAVREGERTPYQRRALTAIELFSEAWLSWQPDVALLNNVMALEVLLGDERDGDKKFRIARRVSYFVCGWPGQRYVDGRRPACPYLTLPIDHRGSPGPELGKRIRDVNAGLIALDCSQFFDVLDLYQARNKIVHGGRIGMTSDIEGPATWFIASWLLRPLLAWYSRHPQSDLAELDAEIAAVPAKGDDAPSA